MAGWIDEQEYVVRCDTATHRQNWKSIEEDGRKIKVTEFRGHIGFKVDAVVTTNSDVRYTNADLWCRADYIDEIKALSDRFTDPTKQKLSTGTVACCIAKLIKFPNSEVGVIGFDTTLAGIHLPDKNWHYHDADGEGELLRYLGIKDYADYG
jgi:hypothetical protein